MECRQCGSCCRIVGKEFWYDHNSYTKEQKELLMSKRMKVESGCEMLDGNNCLVHKLLGFNAKPRICREYYCDANHNI